jgi:hypothetical protein
MLSVLLASVVLWQGPALAGESVVWVDESQGVGALHVWSPRRGDRVVFRGESLAIGRPFAASRTRLAFERSYPSCPPPPGHVCPEGSDAVIGALAGPFRPLSRPRTCFLPGLGNALALDGSVAAYVQLDCTQQRLRVIVGGRVVHDAAISSGCCRDIALAGRYVAWSDRNSVVVHDWTARRTAYRVHVGRQFDFDLQRDGKVAVASPPTIAWVSRAQPLLHLLPFRITSARVAIAGDRVAFERAGGALVVAPLEGPRARAVSRSGAGKLRGFDFDGKRIAWASDRIRSRRVDCPPPGQGRPCVRRVTGTTTIWRRTLATGATRMIARLRFEDAFGR